MPKGLKRWYGEGQLKPILRSVQRSLPPRGREFSRFAYQRIRSLWNLPLKKRLFGDKADLIPPFDLMQDGIADYTDFKQNGIKVFNLFLTFGLQPTARILDVGCGIGRKTVPLLDFLKNGSYEGIDPVQKQVKWCSEKITPRYPNFRFHRVDLWSKLYNPSGLVRPSEYVFPFRDGEFDFVILSSLFTHMFSADMLHYVSEISRLLTPGGAGLVTLFLLNPESERLIADGQSTVNLIHETEHRSKADNPDRLETAVGHQEDFIREAFRSRRIAMEVVEYGSWCGRANEFYYQDFARLTRL